MSSPGKGTQLKYVKGHEIYLGLLPPSSGKIPISMGYALKEENEPNLILLIQPELILLTNPAHPKKRAEIIPFRKEYYASQKMGQLIKRRIGAPTGIAIHDAMNRLKTVTNALGKVMTYNYDGVGNVTSVVDYRGKTWSFEYDAIARRTKIIDPAGNSTTFTYANAAA